MRQQGPQLLVRNSSPAYPVLDHRLGRSRPDVTRRSLQSTLEATAPTSRARSSSPTSCGWPATTPTKMADLLSTAVERPPSGVGGSSPPGSPRCCATAGQPSSVHRRSPRPTATTSTTSPCTDDREHVDDHGTGTTPRPRPRAGDRAAQPQLLTDLRDGGWLAYQPPEGGSADDPLLTTGGYRYVVVSGADATRARHRVPPAGR